MATYKCIRKCHWAGRKWEEGAVVELQVVPPHHFVMTQGDKPTTALKSIVSDPMKVIEVKEVNTFSEMAESNQMPMGGFASSLSNEKPITSMKQLKKTPKSKG